jgi:hypothetical protein
MRIMRFLFGASLVGAGAVAIACSSSSPAPSGGGEGGTEASTSSGSSSGGSSTSSSSGMAEAAPCTLVAANPETIDGGALWACYQKTCATSLTACAADCVCNNGFITALMNIAMMGQSTAMSQLTTAAGVDTAAGTVGTCLLMALTSGTCGGATGGEGGTEGGSEGGGSDAAKTGDAPTGG